MPADPTWHLITGEYPEQAGGVSDYTRSLARGLAAHGEDVHVWAPPFHGETSVDAGVHVHRLPGHFDLRSLRVLGAALNAWPRPSRLLVQYVPHAFGWKAMNVAFARWLRRRRQPVWVMFHEVNFPWESRQPLKHQLLGIINARMAAWVAQAAERIFVTIPAWRTRLRQLTGLSNRIQWLPVLSNLPTEADSDCASQVRAKFDIPLQPPLIGHFGTYGDSVTQSLTPWLLAILQRDASRQFLLIGQGSERYATQFRQWSDRVRATGVLPAAATSNCIAACDLLLQPYPDGLCCRRSSAMAILALGRPMVSTWGKFTEPIWRSSQAVELASANPAELVAIVEELLADTARRELLADNARLLYANRFSLEHTLEILLEKTPALLFPDELT